MLFRMVYKSGQIFLPSQFTHVTDRQTDKRTDKILIARPRLHSMQRGKKHIHAGQFEAGSLRLLTILFV